MFVAIIYCLIYKHYYNDLLLTQSSIKGCTRFAAANDKVYQVLAHGWWFPLGTPASSTTKTGRNDIAAILLKVALSTKSQA